MTPHREWFKTYKPCKVPVRLADNNVIYAAGIGSIVFTPIIDGVPLRQLEFSGVLHVPLLANNLLSVLTLTKKKNWEVNIRKSTMNFMLNSQVHFQASVSDDNTALLDGATVVQAALRTTSSFSPDLWDRCFCHIGRTRLKQLLYPDLNIGTFPTSPLPDICEHCLAGKQHCFPFPQTASNRHKQPLELVHSD
ncbi:uncharacterized protein EI90DRAFT_2894785, partial [Cantharellus anzutake]|uniref:uncharacterized protein n=1 Tax=Cantharellus anzutake TaxID=1750568 RepID=UPI0019068EB8